MKSLLVLAVVNNHVEAAGHGDDELMALFQRMTGAIRATGHVVEIEHALDRERNVPLSLDKSQIATRVRDFGQVNDLTLTQFHNDDRLNSILYRNKLWFGNFHVPIPRPELPPGAPAA